MASFSTQFRPLVLRINSNAYSLYYKALWAGSFLVRFLSLVPFRFVYSKSVFTICNILPRQKYRFQPFFHFLGAKNIANLIKANFTGIQF